MRFRHCSRRCTSAPTTTCRRFRCRSSCGFHRRNRLPGPHDAPADHAPALVAQFRDYLRRHGLPVTRQRELIAGTLARTADYPSADSLARALRSSGEPIGTATVYRTLELMVVAGLARASDFGGRVRRYEALAGQPAHGHLVCRRCGRVTEFASKLLERMMPVLADEHGLVHEEHRIEIHGICRSHREVS